MSDTGHSVTVQNVTTGASIAFNGDVTDTGTGILVDSNSGGEVSFFGNLAMTIDTPGDATAVLATNNSGTNIDFAGNVVINSTSTADGFIATGGGNISMPGTTNSVSTETGQPVKITGMVIANTGANIGDVNRTASAGTNAIQIENNTGGPITIGNTTDLAGDAGTIAGGTVDAIRIVDSANVTVTGIRVNNGSGVVDGVHVEKSNTAAMTVNLNDLEINGGRVGVNTVGGGTGALTMTDNDNAINGSLAEGMEFTNVNNTGATPLQVNAAIIDGQNANSGNGGVLIQNSNGSITFDSATCIRNFGGTDFEVSGGAGTISFAGGIVNSSTVNPADTTGQSVHIHGITGGSVTFTAASTINDTNGGMLVENNGTGSVSFLGSNTFNTTGNAVVLNNNAVGGTDTTLTFAGLNIKTTGTGSGFVATNGGNLSVTGTTNQIDTDNGTGLAIAGLTIGSVDFEKVTVDGTTGPTNAILLENLTGGLVSIGPGTGAVGAGGSVKATGDAIVIQNVQIAMLSQVRVTSAGSAVGDNGVEISHTAAGTTAMDVTIDGLQVDSAFDAAVNVTGANSNNFNLRLNDSTLNNNVAVALTGTGHFGLLVDNTDITTSGTDVGFSLAQSGAARNADLTIRNGSSFTTGDAQALLINSSGATGKTVNLLVQDSSFANNSAGSATADITAQQTTIMNQTVQGNTFTNSGAGTNYSTTATGAAAVMNLNLGVRSADRNTAAGGLAEYDLHNLSGATFNVFDKTDTFANTQNTGTVVPDPNAAAFGNLATPPTLPTVP